MIVSNVDKQLCHLCLFDDSPLWISFRNKAFLLFSIPPLSFSQTLLSQNKPNGSIFPLAPLSLRRDSYASVVKSSWGGLRRSSKSCHHRSSVWAQQTARCRYTQGDLLWRISSDGPVQASVLHLWTRCLAERHMGKAVYCHAMINSMNKSESVYMKLFISGDAAALVSQ